MLHSVRCRWTPILISHPLANADHCLNRGGASWHVRLDHDVAVAIVTDEDNLAVRRWASLDGVGAFRARASRGLDEGRPRVRPEQRQWGGAGGQEHGE